MDEAPYEEAWRSAIRHSADGVVVSERGRPRIGEQMHFE
jgi:hypothetical protein